MYFFLTTKTCVIFKKFYKSEHKKFVFFEIYSIQYVMLLITTYTHGFDHINLKKLLSQP
jgi:hypothetical protein